MKRGQILIIIIVLIFIGIILITGLLSWAVISQKVSQKNVLREKAFHIAEAGNEYYRWHLAHAPQDYQDGQNWCCSNPPCSWCGPYVHDYKDGKGKIIGQFILRIKPPPIGSTIVTVNSTGKVIGEPFIKRIIETKLAISSWAKYAVAANDKMRFGEGTTVYGEIHSNDGIRFDGVAYNVVKSAKTTYVDPDDGQTEWAVHTHIPPRDPFPPNPLPNRPDIFKAGRQISVPAIDFASISGNLAEIKAKAQENGYYFPPSGYLGYHIVLKTNDVFDIYRVTSLMPYSSGCRANQDGWGTWSIKNETLIPPANRPFPNNGLIFVEDNLWIDGQINTARLTIASAKFPENPSTNTSITINNDLLYTNYDGQDVIGLIAQKNINVGLYSENDLQIDAALIAKNGRVGRYYYNSSCGSNYIREKI
ncbi:MAG: hypothetical protein ACK413_01745, partial [Patescibacteria group bacterium]